MSMTPPAPAPEPDDVSRGLAELELYVAAQTPAPTSAVPALPAAVPVKGELEEVGETKRVKQLRDRVAEAHHLVALQGDDAPLLVDSGKVRRRRARVAEAARLYALAQDPSALAWRDARVRKVSTAMTMSAACIALAVSSVGVQKSVVTGLDIEEGSLGWWAAFGVEPAMSLPLLAAVGVQAYAAMRGRVIDRKSPEGKKLFKIEALLLGLTLALNCWPAFTADVFDVLALVVHSLGPIAAVASIWILPTLWAVLALLSVPLATGPTVRPTAAQYSANAVPAAANSAVSVGAEVGVETRTVDEHRARLHALIVSGDLPRDASATAIRRALGCGTEIASKLRDELRGGGA